MRRAFRTQPSLVCCNIPIANLPISGRFGKGSQGGKASPQRVRRATALEKDFACEGVAVGAGSEYWYLFAFLCRCVGPTCIVRSFEPAPDNFKRLQSATCKLANVRLSRASV
jgi:hypothetical protein